MSQSLPYDHIVFVSLDTLRSDGIAANPYKLWPERYPGLRAPRTAVLDRLSAAGAFFPNAISSAPYTSASHATILSGLYPLRHGLHAFYGGRLRAPTIFTHARRLGFRTVMKVDFPVILGAELGFTRDIDSYLVEDDDGFIAEVTAADRSVSMVHFAGLHLPYGFHKLKFGGDDYRAKVAELEAALPPDIPRFVDDLTETHRDGEDYQLFHRYKQAAGYLYDSRRYAELFQLYLDGIEYFLERRFEPFVDRLMRRTTAQGKSVLLVIFGDHGYQFEDDSWGNFNSLAEGVLRVPVLFIGDGIVPGLHKRRIRTIDIVPTALDLAGFSVARGTGLDGTSLAPVVRGDSVLEVDAPALAQAYTADPRTFMEFQRRQRAGEDPGFLPHVLLGEAAYHEDRRLVRLFHRYAESMSTMVDINHSVVERFDDRLVPRTDPDGLEADLGALLEDYNSLTVTEPGATAPEAVRQGLRNLGYPV
ncbi:sulfatase-like hydrolase/transferase [Streptomyces tendae]|uniref:sulfatase-like hydrolase/transferase n=1 Tax=Streptomyces tendae TaxID=1932 RepID=UPI0036AE4100